MNNNFLIAIVFPLVALGCVKDRISDNSGGSGVHTGSQLIHYWGFNKSDSIALLTPDTTIGGGFINFQAATIDTVQPGSSINLRMGIDSGGAIRMRNPFAYMIIKAPTTGFKTPVLTFAGERSNSGPAGNTVQYTIDGTNWLAAPTSTLTLNTTWALYTIDFGSISAVDDNANFAIKLVTTNNNTGTSGNDRYDNISIDAVKK